MRTLAVALLILEGCGESDRWGLLRGNAAAVAVLPGTGVKTSFSLKCVFGASLGARPVASSELSSACLDEVRERGSH